MMDHLGPVADDSLPAGLQGCPDSRAEPSEGTVKWTGINSSLVLVKREVSG